MAEKKTKKRKFRNPLRSFVKVMVTLHTVRVGEGAIEPSETVEREIELANGAKYALSIRRISASTNKDVGAFEFAPIAKKAAKK